MQHRHKRISTVLALLSGISIFTGAAAPAQALTLMDLIRGGPGRDDAADRGLPGVGREATPSEKVLADPEPAPKIRGPRYYAYKPEAERAVNTAGFAAASATDGTELLAQAKFRAPAEIAATLEAFYGKTAKPLWVSHGDVNDKAKAVLALFEQAGDYGLDPADYLLTPPVLTTASVAPASSDVRSSEGQGVITEVSAAPATGQSAPAAVAAAPAGHNDSFDRTLMNFELALSGKVLMFAQDMIRGRIDPNRISGYHDFKRKEVNLSVVLPFAKSSADAAAYLRALEPKGAQFQALKAELARLNAEEAVSGGRIALPNNLLLKPGNSSDDMAKVVAAVQKAGSDALLTEHSVTLATYQQTPDYTPELVELVKSFQVESGLTPDGVVGPATVRKMIGHTSEAKIAKLMVAMEQARWLPADLGERYVFINQPAYRAYYHENGAEQFSMRVVIGSRSNQTYFFQDQIETVEFNPYWGVPQSIIVNEMLPKLRRDPSYLDRLGYEVAVNGRAVPSSAVDWFSSTRNISVRQPPSSDNALGDLKILFPNTHAIYMHDTPSKSFFQRDMRALSHGCVRLAEPRKMAAAVLGTTVEDVDARIAGGQNVGARVTANIPVYVAYFTAWPNKVGKVEYFHDVYERDAAVRKAFAATTKARAAKI